jgi:Protein of unknown function (DUF3040)
MEVTVMSLSAREQQALDFIEDRLAGSDPRLASLLATFARLTSDEDMPVREKIRAAGRRDTHGLLRLFRLFRRPGFQRAAPLLWLLITFAMIAVALVLSGGRGATCTRSWQVMCTAPVPTGSSPAAAHQAAAGPALRATG